MRKISIVAAAVVAACGEVASPLDQLADPGAHITPPRVIAVALPAPGFEVPAPTDRIVGLGMAGDHACVVRASGAVDCWGRFGAGRPEPHVRRIAGVDDATAIDSTADCVERRSGGVACFAADRDVLEPASGLTAAAALQEVATKRDPAKPIAGVPDAVLVADRCALRAQGSVVCWGSNAGGALGQPTTIGRYLLPPTPIFGLANIERVVLGAADSWALARDGRVYHWGRNATSRATLVPLPTEARPIAELVVTDYGSACVRGGAHGDAVWCTAAPNPATFAEIHASGVRSIAATDRELLALVTDGKVITTSIDPDLDPSHANYVRHAIHDAPADAEAILAAGSDICIVQHGGGIACRLLATDAWTPVPGLAAPVVVRPTAVCPAQARPGVPFTCRWVGLDKIETFAEPALAEPATLVPGADRICALRASGRVTCWRGRGLNVPTFDLFAEGVAALALGAVSEPSWSSAAGWPYGCAVMTDRTVQCFGANVDGALGDGSVRESATPLGVPGL